MKRMTKVVLAIASVALLAGCSAKANAPAAALAVKIENSAFSTKEMTVEKGKTYQLSLENKDVQLHDFSIEKISVKVDGAKGADHGHSGTKEPDLHVAAEAGKTATLSFAAQQPGTYTWFCSVPGHKEMGMTGKLIVK